MSRHSIREPGRLIPSRAGLALRIFLSSVSAGRNIEVDDDALGTVAFGELNPGQARALLKLVLLTVTQQGKQCTPDAVTVQDYYDRC